MLQEITREEIQTIRNKEQLINFFALLGYTTDGMPPTPPKKSWDIPDDIKDDIEFLEQIANIEDEWTIYIFLIKLKNNRKAVPATLIKRVAQAFRDLAGDYLLVFTTDYSQIDIVLLERSNAPYGTIQHEIVTKWRHRVGGAYPRILTIHPDDPDAVTLRVLNLLAYEPGQSVYTQSELLRSAYDVAYWSEPFFNNRSLFSDHYLNTALPALSEWSSSATGTTMTRLVRQLGKLYRNPIDDYMKQPDPLQATQNKLIQEVLALLGFAFTRRSERTPREQEPDYTLYLPGDDGKPEGQPLAFCLAYNWKRDLDRQVDESQDPHTPGENPGALVVSLLEKKQANWAIVTNGKLWRLYAAKAHSRATNYYEIDLAEIATRASEQATAFKYFWFLFRRDAFLPSQREGDRRISWLDLWLDESEKYARELEGRIKRRVFNDVFPYFAQGFVEYDRTHNTLPIDLKMMDEATRTRELSRYYDATLTFLYRLLVLLYAESRGLLPVRESSSYYEKSLEKLKKEIAEAAGRIYRETPGKIRRRYLKESTRLYDTLLEVFHAIDKGDKDLNIPIYDGGLFISEPTLKASADDDGSATLFDEAAWNGKGRYASHEDEVAQFLLDHKIPDQFVVLGLDRLARDEDEKTDLLVQIDYKSLGVRQLGSIYEGLLENKLRMAVERMAVVATGRSKKQEKIVPVDEARRNGLSIVRERIEGEWEERIYDPDKVYLETDTHERKITGSYYTPDYIVKYIVAQTAIPALKAKLDQQRRRFQEAHELLRFQKNQLKAGKAVDPEEETYKHYENSLVVDFFDLKVLDPAMGSGHFLVEAVDQITDEMIRFLTGFGWNPITHHLKKERQKIEQEMKSRGFSIDVEKLTDNNLLKRHVLKSCIYGVDVNPMAVELAKVSLWLDGFTAGAPFSFLNHHLKCGNSLIGASAGTWQDALQQIRNLHSFEAAELLQGAHMMRRLSQNSDITYEGILQSQVLYEESQQLLRPSKLLMDLWISEYFGNKNARSTVRIYARDIIDHKTLANKVDRDALAQARLIAGPGNKNFFHWPLEFPEVFMGKDGNLQTGGFDVVIGNPPYVRQEGLGADKVAFQQIYSIYNGIADLYTYFIERSHMLLRPGGRFGMITANKFMRANYGASLRSYLTDKVRLEKLIDFGDLPVFGEATTYPIILLSANAPRDGSPIEYAVVRSLDFADLGTLVATATSPLPDSAFQGSNWSLAQGTEQKILEKLSVNTVSLQDFASSKIRRGIITGLNEAFIIDQATRDRLIAEDPKNAEIIKPFLVGADIRRYSIDFQNRYLLWTYIGVPINRYPAIFKHLQQYQPQLEKRWDKGNHWWELRHCDYYAEFAKPRIIYQEIATYQSFSYLTEEIFANAKCFIIPTDDLALLALLNSKLIWFWLSYAVSKLQGGAHAMQAEYLVKTPIRRIAFTTPEQERDDSVEELEARYRQHMQKVIEGADKQTLKQQQDEILALVEECLAREPEQADVVHDLLAFLAEEMLRLNREKRSEEQRFFSALSRLLGIRPDRDGRTGIDSLKGEKEKRISDFAGDYQRGRPMLSGDDTIRILKKNNGRFRSFDEAAIRRQHKESAAIIGPLTEKLKWTDGLIDEVVYRLYGLTPEERDVVREA
jgi:hypothetical protein